MSQSEYRLVEAHFRADTSTGWWELLLVLDTYSTAAGRDFHVVLNELKRTA